MIGPVLAAELLTTSRRRRYYGGRLVYGLVLLFVLWSNYAATFGVVGGGQTYAVDQMTMFSNVMLRSLTIAQVAAVALLTPALVSGVIASETQRKTLHYLLASELTSVGIVAGKLLARMLHVVVFLSIGLPVVSLLTLFGGVDPLRVLWSFGLSMVLAYYLACLSMLASTIAGRVRGAVMLGYTFVAAWVLLPFLVAFVISPLQSETLTDWLVRAFYWAYPGGMIAAALEASTGIRRPNPALLVGFDERWAWAVSAVQLILWGTGFLALAAARLRPLSQRRETRSRVVIGLDKKGRHRLRILPRPPVGPDPMMWKERHTSRAGGVARLLMSLGALSGFVLIGCVTYDAIQRAIIEIRGDWWEDFGTSTGRGEFNQVLRGLTATIGFVWLLGTAITAAGGVAGEREEDTWISLTATPLTGWEILRAKMLGAILRFKSLAWTLAILWGLGLATGSVHPAGVLIDCAVLIAALAFVAALGTYFSLRSSSVLKALSATVLWLLILNAGVLIDNMPIGKQLGHVARMMTVTTVLDQGMLSYPEANIIMLGYDPHASNQQSSVFAYNDYYYSARPDRLRLTIFGAVAALFFHALGAAVLTWMALLAFDQQADRPRRSRFLHDDLTAKRAREAASTALPTADLAG